METDSRADDGRVRRRLPIVILPAAILATSDVAVKLLVPTQAQLFHERGHAWLALSLVLLCGAVGFAALPSRLLAVASAILAGGVLGNLLSARWQHGRVANPFVIEGRAGGIAFNLADCYVLLGILLTMTALVELTFRYRSLLPQSTVAVRLLRRLRR
jgi:lipoprotein signal peptidase